MGNDEKSLSSQQEAVIVSLLAGKTQKDAAEAAGVSAETVSRWMHSDALFVATLNARRQELWDMNSAALRDLAKEATAVLKDLLDSPDDRVRLRSVLAILKTQGLDVGDRPCGSTSPGHIEADWRHQAMIDAMF